MLLDHLRSETRTAHQALEKILIPRIKNIAVRDDYAGILKIFYGFFIPLEQKIFLQLQAQTLPDVSKRRKAGVLARDISALGINSLPVLCTELPEIANEADALAALYVMEGSTLGGKIITQMIRNKLDLTPENGISFFYGYGDDTEEKWQQFVQVLNSYTADLPLIERMAHTAHHTFISFKNWVVLN